MSWKEAQKQPNKKVEVHTLYKVNKSWQEAENASQHDFIKDTCVTTTKIEFEKLDETRLFLSIKSQAKPLSVQKRILRRIVEKRQAQANHKKNGRSNDLTYKYVTRVYINKCMSEI